MQSIRMRSLASPLNMISIVLVGSQAFNPDLALLLAESFYSPSSPDGNTLAYSRYLSNRAAPHKVEATEFTDMHGPAQFTDRVAVMLADPRFGGDAFKSIVEQLDSSCIDQRYDPQYPVSSDPSVAVAQAGILASVLAMRSRSCAYSRYYLEAFLTRNLRAFVSHWRAVAESTSATAPDPRASCYAERAKQAIDRLGYHSSISFRGILTLDACHMGYAATASQSPIAVSWSTKLLPGELVQIEYNGATDHIPGTPLKAWLKNPPAVINQASVWVNVLTGFNNSTMNMLDLLSINNQYTVSIQSFSGNSHLTLTYTCTGGLFKYANSTIVLTTGWHLVSVGVQDGVATITFDQQSWELSLPVSLETGCGRPSASLGPRSWGIPSGRKAAGVVARFYGLEVSATVKPMSLYPTLTLLNALGGSTPAPCLTLDGFESRVSLTRCAPSPATVVERVTADSAADQTFWTLCLLISAFAVFFLASLGVCTFLRFTRNSSTQAIASELDV